MSTKTNVLKVLEHNRDKAVSGQELAEKLNVSRAAIWKVIKALQDDGHKIHATTNKGYQLATQSDMLSAEGIRFYLWSQNYDYPITVYKSIDSTNSQAKRMAVDGAAHGTILLAEEQTAGRGRSGKSFFSPSNTGIYMSLILRPQTGIADSQLITVAVAVAVCKAIERVTNLHPQIKWVNDLYLNGKKICGILTEAVSDFESGSVESINIGIGLNCSTAEDAFPEELRSIAGSLQMSNVSRNQLAAQIINEVLACGNDLTNPAVIEEYKGRSLIIGKEITYEKGRVETTGTAYDINDRGNLLVKTRSSETDILFSGEVTIRRQII